MPPLKAGSKVICKDNCRGELNLTIGRTYITTRPFRSTGSNRDYIYTTNDKGEHMCYMHYRFTIAVENKEFTDEEYESLLV